MKLRTIVAALTICISLTSCGGGTGRAYGEISQTNTEGIGGPVSQTAIKFGVEVTFPFGGRGMMHAMNVGAVDAAEIAVDISTYNAVVLDSAGTGTLVAKQGDTVIGSTSFSYVILDSMAVAANPTAVNAWLANFPSADGYEVELTDVQTVDLAPGTASMTAEAIYGTTVVTTVSSSWTAGGSGCVGNPGGGGDPFPEMPQMPIDDPGVGCP